MIVNRARGVRVFSWMLAPMMLTLSLISGCGMWQSQASRLEEAMDAQNSAEQFLGNLLVERRAGFVPGNNSVEQPVWSGDYFPMSLGGTARALPGEVSPMVKYERATQTRGADAWERQDAERQSRLPWAGHCNGLAAAGVATREPRRQVMFRGISFSVDDVKALLVESYQKAISRGLGRRCWANAVPVDEFGRYLPVSCRDANAGGVYLSVTNLVGIHRLPLIIDRAAGDSVWNSVITSYVLSQTEISRPEAGLLVAGDAFREEYSLHREALRFMKARLELKFAPQTLRAYEMVVELNAEGEVIGGEWIGESRKNHPDFLWTVSGPGLENPHLDLSVIQQIHQLSL